MSGTLLERADEESSSEEAKKAERAGILASLRAEWKFIRWWEISDFGLVVCRRLRRAEVLAFTKLSHAANKKHDADGDAAGMLDVNESTVKTCCVWPKDADSLKKVFNDYPNFSTQAALAIWQMQDEGVTEGKE